jgi:hypothetical protein
VSTDLVFDSQPPATRNSAGETREGVLDEPPPAHLRFPLQPAAKVKQPVSRGSALTPGIGRSLRGHPYTRPLPLATQLPVLQIRQGAWPFARRAIGEHGGQPSGALPKVPCS